MNKKCDVILAVLPWAPVTAPSIQLGLLKALLDREGIATKTAHLNVEFYKFLGTKPDYEHLRLPPSEHDVLHLQSPLFTWVFAVPPVFTDTVAIDEYMADERAKKVEPDELDKHDKFAQLRSLAPEFFDYCLDEILKDNPRVVGFSCSLGDRVPTLVLSKLLKMKKPDLHIVLGGTSMDGIMGEVAIRAFPWIDTVVRGDGETVLPTLIRELLANAPVSPQPGLCVRQGETVTIHAESPRGKAILMDNPVPDYHEYFQRIQDTDISEEGNIHIPIETSRGCWWFKRKCKFCGRSEESLRYRTKTVGQVANEMRVLSATHQYFDFQMVDSCVQSKFLIKLMQILTSEGLDFKTWCQGRVNFTRLQLEQLGRTGVHTIFMGIESLSTPVLNLMNKGHTALEAVRAMKWGMEYGITISWNLIYRFPNEKAEYYEDMADLMRSLTHFKPAFHVIPLLLVRYSVYCDDPGAYGIQLKEHISPMDDSLSLLASQQDDTIPLADLSDAFEGKYPRLPSEALDACKKVYQDWVDNFAQTKGQLWYRRGMDFVRVYDSRFSGEQQIYTLDDLESKIYLACNDGASVDDVWNSLSSGEQSEISREEVKDFLDQLVQSRLSIEENGVYLSLALSLEGSKRAQQVSALPPM
jgi:magnesium-protoporphyrin IX monomethyl ester (oxidative) cyclase